VTITALFSSPLCTGMARAAIVIAPIELAIEKE
jgi:hypothetical protein